MKLIRFLSKCVIVTFLFVLGVSAADKEYLKDSIIGIQIYSCGSDLDESLVDYLMDIDADSAQELSQKILAYNECFDICVEDRYFEASVQDHFLIPGGMYTTVIVNKGKTPAVSFTKSIAPINYRFCITEESVISYVQNGYVTFLTYWGLAEKMIINFQDGL